MAPDVPAIAPLYPGVIPSMNTFVHFQDQAPPPPEELKRGLTAPPETGQCFGPPLSYHASGDWRWRAELASGVHGRGQEQKNATAVDSPAVPDNNASLGGPDAHLWANVGGGNISAVPPAYANQSSVANAYANQCSVGWPVSMFAAPAVPYLLGREMMPPNQHQGPVSTEQRFLVPCNYATQSSISPQQGPMTAPAVQQHAVPVPGFALHTSVAPIMTSPPPCQTALAPMGQFMTDPAMQRAMAGFPVQAGLAPAMASQASVQSAAAIFPPQVEPSHADDNHAHFSFGSVDSPDPAGQQAPNLPQPQTLRQELSADRTVCLVEWFVDARKLKSDKLAVSPAFPLQLAPDLPAEPFKLSIHTKKDCNNFRKSKGVGYITLKCEGTPTEVAANLRFSFGIGSGAIKQKSRRLIDHNFSSNCTAGLSTDMDTWDFSSVVDEASKTMVVWVEIASVPLERTPCQ